MLQFSNVIFLKLVFISFINPLYEPIEEIFTFEIVSILSASNLPITTLLSILFTVLKSIFPVIFTFCPSDVLPSPEKNSFHSVAFEIPL